jgi:DNA-binding transcriptional LysR family regulator
MEPVAANSHTPMNQLWTAAYLETFARIVQLNGFSAAARAIGVPKAAVSRALSALEAELGLQLLRRTTRRIEVTEVGMQILECAQRIAAATDEARHKAGRLAERHDGPLRVAADPALGRVLLTPLVPRFLESFPDRPLEVRLAAVTDFDLEDWDVAVRPAAPEHPELTARLLGEPPAVLCATPQYLAGHGEPTEPEELGRHALLVPSGASGECRLLFEKGPRRAEVRAVPKLAVNDPAVIHAAAAAGLGIALLPEFLCRQGLAQARLKRVLPDWQAPRSGALYAVYRKALAADVRVVAFVDFLAANIVPALVGS